VVAPDDSGLLLGLQFDEPRVPPQGSVLDDIEAFARELQERAGDGLGWS
jgi:hypothetical protein